MDWIWEMKKREELRMTSRVSLRTGWMMPFMETRKTSESGFQNGDGENLVLLRHECI